MKKRAWEWFMMIYTPAVGALLGNTVGDLVGALVGRAVVGTAVGGVRNEERASVSTVFRIVDADTA